MSPDEIRALMDRVRSCSLRERDNLTWKLIKALKDPRWYLAGWNMRPGLPHLKARVP